MDAPVPAATVSVRTSFSRMNGVDQLCPRASRSTRQTSLPVLLSNAAMNDRVVLSLTMYNRSP